MSGTIANAATGSAHHHPSRELRIKPPSRITERYMQICVWRASAVRALLESCAATRRLARARSGMTINDPRAIDDSGHGLVRTVLSHESARRIHADIGGQKPKASPNDPQ